MSPSRGGHPSASGTEAALQGADTSSSPPATCLGAPPLPHTEEVDPQKTGSDTEQRRLVLGAGRPAECLQKAAPGGRPEPAPLAPGGVLVSFPKLPPWKPGRRGAWPQSGHAVGGWGARPEGGRAAQSTSTGGGAYSPMHVRPSECRAYFWWQPHVGPVSVSSQLCWQPPFP